MSEPVDPQELARVQYAAGQQVYQPPYYDSAVQAHYPGYPTPPAPPPSTGRKPGITAALVTVVVVAVAAIAVVVGPSSHPSASDTGPLPLPASLDNQPRLTDASADRFRSQLETLFGAGGEEGELVTKGTIGVYGAPADATSRIIVLAAHSSLFPDLTPSGLSGSVFGAVGTGQSYPAGSNGGAVECLATNVGQEDEAICIWSDRTTLGFVIAVGTSLSADQVASLTNTARDTIDH